MSYANATVRVDELGTLSDALDEWAATDSTDDTLTD